MGTAYCVEVRAGRIVWKVSPDGDKAMGSNTSSPCVAKGRMYFGTTAGNFHILDCKDGKTVKTLAIGMPVISSPTFANDAIYFQALDAVLRCLDLDGNEKWKWDHYKRYSDPPDVAKKRGFPGSFDRPHYGGGDVTVSGTQVVTSIGWDLVCLADKDKAAELTWCRRAPGLAPMSSTISSGYVYTAGVEADGALGLMRFSLADGTNAAKGAKGIPVQWTTAVARGALVSTRESSYCKDSIVLFDCSVPKTMAGWLDDKMATPMVSSPALSRDHLVFTTLKGDVLALDLVPKPRAQPFKFRTPNGKGIGSSPAVSGGCVSFGCDDGYLYVLGPGGALQPAKDPKLAVHEPRSKLPPATGKAYGWIATAANQQGTNFVDDPELKPPFRLRWAARAFGHFKTPAVATEDGDVLSLTLSRTVTCQEQATGRLRWRVRLPVDLEEWGGSAGLLVDGGRVFVPVANNRAYPQKGMFYCLDQKTGAVAWSAEIGSKDVFSRPSPVVAEGKVAFSFTRKGNKEGETAGSVVQAWDAATGQPAWTVELNAPGGDSFGVTDGKSFYYSAAAQYNGPRPKGKPAETVAIEAATGKVLWRTSDFASGLQIALKGECLYMFDSRTICISARDGTPVWTNGVQDGCGRYLSLGPDFYTLRGYGGGAGRAGLADGKPVPFKDRGAQLGGDAHACGPVALTPNLSVNVTVNGLHVRDAKTGALLWLSPGFAPRGCVNPSIANGRVFWPSAASGLVFCWEPEK